MSLTSAIKHEDERKSTSCINAPAPAPINIEYDQLFLHYTEELRVITYDDICHWQNFPHGKISPLALAKFRYAHVRLCTKECDLNVTNSWLMTVTGKLWVYDHWPWNLRQFCAGLQCSMFKCFWARGWMSHWISLTFSLYQNSNIFPLVVANNFK